MVSKLNIPTLRFPEFQGEWEEKRFSEAIKTARLGGNYSNSEIKTKCPLIKMGNIGRGAISLDKLEYIVETDVINDEDLLKEGDLLFNTRNTLDLVGKVSVWRGELDLAYYNSNLLRFKFKSSYVDNNYFMNYLFNTISILRKLKSLATGTTSVAAIYSRDLFNLSFSLPSLPEQRKIASFFSLLDQRIENQQEKIRCLEEYKRGLMQKIFSQEIRFKDDNGEDYPEWEEKRLGDVGTFYNGLSGKKKEDFGDGNSGFIQYMDVFNYSVFPEGRLGKVIIHEGEKQNTVEFGDVLFTQSSETVNEVGMSSIWLYNAQDVYLNSFCFGYRFNSLRDKDVHFIAFLMRSPEVRQKIVTEGQGSTRFNLSSSRLAKVSISLPSFPEQHKIGQVLSKIDELIEKNKELLEQWKLLKKGLLQQMFI